MKPAEKQERKNYLITQIYTLKEEEKYLSAIRTALIKGYVDFMYPCLRISGTMRTIGDTLIYLPEQGGHTIDIPLWESQGRLPQALALLITDLQEQVLTLEQEIEKLK